MGGLIGNALSCDVHENHYHYATIIPGRSRPAGAVSLTLPSVPHAQ